MSAPRARPASARARDAIGRSPGSVAARSGPACGISRSRRKPSSSACAELARVGAERARAASANDDRAAGAAIEHGERVGEQPDLERLGVRAHAPSAAARSRSGSGVDAPRRTARVAEHALAEVARGQQVAVVLERDPVAVRRASRRSASTPVGQHLRAQAVEVGLADVAEPVRGRVRGELREPAAGCQCSLRSSCTSR